MNIINLESGAILAIDPSPDLIAGMAKIRSRHAGFIVGDSEHYYSGDIYIRFSDPTEAQEPRIYRRHRDAARLAIAHNDPDNLDRPQSFPVAVMVFFHPEFAVPAPIIARYALMTGNPFPGSPRR